MRVSSPGGVLVGLAPLFVAAFWATGCATYRDELRRAQRAFESSEHERALAALRALEPDIARLSPVERAQYAYLRGMTDYRIGYRSDARHWLAVASALEHETPEALPPDWEKRMTDSLEELDEEVYAAGIASLASSPPPGAGGTAVAPGAQAPDAGSP